MRDLVETGPETLNMALPPSTTAHSPIGLLLSYPEQTPFDLKPVVYNLTPGRDSLESFISPEVRAAALAIANRTAVNIFMRMQGRNPLLLADHDYVRFEKEQTPADTNGCLPKSAATSSNQYTRKHRIRRAAEPQRLHTDLCRPN